MEFPPGSGKILKAIDLAALGIDSFLAGRSQGFKEAVALFLAPPSMFSAFVSALITLAIFEGAYITEIVRAGIESIEKGTWEAAYALGLSPQLLPLWIAHEVAHTVRYTSPTSRSDLKRLVAEAGGSYDYWETGSRATLRDLSLAFVGSGADVLVIENSDQPGGRIFCDQVLCGGNDASKRCDISPRNAASIFTPANSMSSKTGTSGISTASSSWRSPNSANRGCCTCSRRSVTSASAAASRCPTRTSFGDWRGARWYLARWLGFLPPGRLW